MEKLTADEARQMLEAEKRQRENDCLTEIRAALEKHNCTLTPVAIITNEKIKQSLEIKAN